MKHDPHGPTAPRTVLRELLGIDAASPAAAGDAGGGTGADAQKRRKHGRGLAGHAGFVAWAERAGRVFSDASPGGVEDLPGGGEHKVDYDPETGRVFKITKPGFFGYQAEDAGAYVERWALHNAAFDDDVRIEGIVTLPGEEAARAVISQPFQPGRDATPEELADYLTERGFYEHEGRWAHPVRETAVWDTITPGNAIMTADGVRVIDLIVGHAAAEELAAVRARAGIGGATWF